MSWEPSEFRSAALAKRLAAQIHDLAQSYPVKICHVCGTHEWTISRYGLRALLPTSVDVIAGPGCPVCVVPAAEIDEAVALVEKGVAIATFGDLVRVPGSERSLMDARANGGDVRIVYSVSDAVKMAQREQNREFVFFAIGFETTAFSTAAEVLNGPPSNLSFLVSHRLIPPAMELLLGIGELHIDGFVAPGHVSTIIGMQPYEIFPKAYRMPTVVAGFEPADVLFAVSTLLKQIRDGEAKLENEYSRCMHACINKAIVVDAVKCGGKPGTIYHFRLDDVGADDRLAKMVSFHELDLITALKIGKEVYKLPREIVIIGVEPKAIEPGLNLSPEVEKSIPEVTRLIFNEIKK